MSIREIHSPIEMEDGGYAVIQEVNIMQPAYGPVEAEATIRFSNPSSIEAIEDMLHGIRPPIIIDPYENPADVVVECPYCESFAAVLTNCKQCGGPVPMKELA